VSSATKILTASTTPSRSRIPLAFQLLSTSTLYAAFTP
jgi:hypothetical protein